MNEMNFVLGTQLFTDENQFVIYTSSGSDHYAFDGNGNAVRITIDESGNIFTILGTEKLRYGATEIYKFEPKK